MRYRKLTADGDYQFGNGQNDFWNNVPDAVGQAAKTGLLLWIGEWFLDLTAGVPYLQGILGKYSQDDADTILKDQLINIQGVTDISDYQSILNPDTRGFSLASSIDTIYGPTEITIQNYGNY